MLYIKIGENKYEAKISTFTTQGGQSAVRLTGEVPIANGFLVVDENDNVVSDKSDFTCLYREGEDFVEYTKVAEDIIPTESYYTGNIPVSPIQKQINALNKRVTDITPYTDTKTAYYGELEKVFYGVPQGFITVSFDNFDGEYTLTRIEDRVKIGFDEKLTEQTNVTIMVQ